MEFSRPDNARLINKLRVLNALRKNEGLSRAELSSELVLNKVSISEIASTLLKEGLITEGEKQEVLSGRPGTRLFLNQTKFAVIGADVSSKVITLSLSNIMGVMLRFERVPINGSVSASLLNALERLTKNTKASIAGMVIATDKPFEEKLNLPFPYSFVSRLSSAVLAEQHSFDNPLLNFEFIYWDEEIKSAYISENSIVENNEFGHLPLFSQGLCSCGSVGCLSIATSTSSLVNLAKVSLKELLTREDDDMLNRAIETMARALVNLSQCTGCASFLIGGTMANLSDNYFAKLQQSYSLLAPHSRRELVVYKSQLKEKGSTQGAVLKALDYYFFKESELKTIGY